MSIFLRQNMFKKSSIIFLHTSALPFIPASYLSLVTMETRKNHKKSKSYNIVLNLHYFIIGNLNIRRFYSELTLCNLFFIRNSHNENRINVDFVHLLCIFCCIKSNFLYFIRCLLLICLHKISCLSFRADIPYVS